MKRIFFGSFMIAVIASCGENKQTKEDTAVSIADSSDVQNTLAQAAAPQECYSFTSAADTVIMNIRVNGNSVTGILHYRLKEKDNNRGVIEGVMNKDTLFADYRFLSEGRSSVREVIFLKTDKGFKEGYGPVTQDSLKTRFEDLSKINFASSFLLQKSDCMD